MRKLLLAAVVLTAAFVAPAATAVPVTAGQCAGAAVLSAGDTNNTYSFKACTDLGVRAAIQRTTNPAPSNITWKITTPRGAVTCSWGATGDPACSSTNGGSGRWAAAKAGDTVTVNVTASGCSNCVVTLETPERPDV